MKRWLVGIGSVIVAFGVGYVPQRMQSQRIQGLLNETKASLENQLRQAHVEGEAASLQGDLAMVMIEVERGNHQKARERSTAFFDKLRATHSTLSTAGKETNLSVVLGRRDEITSALALQSPEAASKLRELLLQLRGEPQPPPPVR